MPQIKPEWEEIPEFITTARKLIEKYPGELGHVNSNLIVAYKCINKTKPEGRTKLYEMKGQSEPEAFTNTKKYFITVFHDTWDNMDAKNRQLIVLSALSRIDKDEPENGKVKGNDMHDQAFMARTFGVDWAIRHDVPDIMSQTVRLVDEPIEQGEDMTLLEIIKIRKDKEAQKPKLPDVIKFTVSGASPARIEFNDNGAGLYFENYSYQITENELRRVLSLLSHAVLGHGLQD